MPAKPRDATPAAMDSDPDLDAIPDGQARVFILPDSDRDEYFDEQTHLAITKTPRVVDGGLVGKNSRLQPDVIVQWPGRAGTKES